MPHKAVILIEVRRIPGDNRPLPHSTGGKNMNLYPRNLLSAALFTLVAASTPALSQDTGWYGGVWFWASKFKKFFFRGFCRRDCCGREKTPPKNFLGYVIKKKISGVIWYTHL